MTRGILIGTARKASNAHKALGKGFSDIGQYVRDQLPWQLDVTNKQLSDSGYRKAFRGIKRDIVKSNVNLLAKRSGRTRKFEDQWRKAAPGHDELFSTASVRDFLTGFFTNPTLSPDQVQWINDVANRISELRIPTHFSGFSRTDETMQHPTRWKDAVFASSSSGHGFYDLERRAYVLRAMEAVKTNRGNAVDTVKAGRRAAIEYTLNYFTAPLGAENILRNSLAFQNNPSLTPYSKVVLKQMKSREVMKEVYVKELGGTLRSASPDETAAQSITRPWPGRSRPMSLQPSISDPSDAAFSSMDRPPSPRRRVEDFDKSKLPPREAAAQSIWSISDHGYATSTSILRPRPWTSDQLARPL